MSDITQTPDSDVLQQQRDALQQIMQRALLAVNGEQAVATWLRNHPLQGEVVVIAIGKAGSSMLAGARTVLGQQLVRALLITKYHHATDTDRADAHCDVIEAAHPVPDENSLLAGQRLLEFIETTPPTTTLLFLISGGTSALVEVLPDDMSLQQLDQINQWLLANSWPISQMNRLRRQYSLIKGGRLLQYLSGRRVFNLLISDVPGDEPATIGSGLLIQSTAGCEVPEAISRIAPLPAKTFAAPADVAVQTVIIASNAQARQAAANHAHMLGYTVMLHDDELDCDVPAATEQIVRCLQESPTGLHIWGGETTLSLPDNPGQGGRNQHLALSIAQQLQGAEDACVLVVGTDGTDGVTDHAGALVDGQSVARIVSAGLDVDVILDAANSSVALQASGDLIDTGPTGTNVMDLVLALKFSAGKRTI